MQRLPSSYSGVAAPNLFCHCYCAEASSAVCPGCDVPCKASPTFPPPPWLLTRPLRLTTFLNGLGTDGPPLGLPGLAERQCQCQDCRPRRPNSNHPDGGGLLRAGRTGGKGRHIRPRTDTDRAACDKRARRTPIQRAWMWWATPMTNLCHVRVNNRTGVSSGLFARQSEWRDCRVARGTLQRELHWDSCAVAETPPPSQDVSRRQLGAGMRNEKGQRDGHKGTIRARCAGPEEHSRRALVDRGTPQGPGGSDVRPTTFNMHTSYGQRCPAAPGQRPALGRR